MRLVNRLLESPLLYESWQAPFAAQESAPVAERSLAALDRRAYARPPEEWERILTTRYKPVVLECHSPNLLGLPLSHMIYFQGLSSR